jgi:hypothetical protein
MTRREWLAAAGMVTLIGCSGPPQTTESTVTLIVDGMI